MSVGPGPVAVLSGIVFAVGAFGLLCRRDGFGLLVSLSVLLLAPVIAFAGFAAAGGGREGGPPAGEMVALTVVVVCAAQAVVGAALVAVLRRRRESVEVDAFDEHGPGGD
jgi:NADH-quinone oxidoreductase subunit K